MIHGMASRLRTEFNRCRKRFSTSSRAPFILHSTDWRPKAGSKQNGAFRITIGKRVTTDLLEQGESNLRRNKSIGHASLGGSISCFRGPELYAAASRLVLSLVRVVSTQAP